MTKKWHLPKIWKWLIGIFVVLIIVTVVIPYFLNLNFLRRHMEQQMNSRLKGYKVLINSAHFQPIGFSVDLKNIKLIQNAHPEPPIGDIGKIHASIDWRELLTANVVGDFLIENPKFYIDLNNVKQEAESDVPLKKKGWQDALQSIYPLKINVFRIKNGELTYVEKGPAKPLRLSDITLIATNIRNIKSPGHSYPSTLFIKANIFDKGKLTIDGRANYLAKPQVGVKGQIVVADIDLSYLKPVTSHVNILTRKGIFAAKGNLEYAHDGSRSIHINDLRLSDVDIDYVHLTETAEEEKQRVKEAARMAKEMSNKPSAKFRADLITIDGQLGYVNRTSEPSYRLYFKDVKCKLINFSNQFKEGPSQIDFRGKFMGTGETVITGNFRAETKNPDFDLNIAIKDTQMPPMSDLFRAYGNFDIKAGFFSFYSEITIKDNQVTGYVKPLFRDMEVYDRRQYRDKNLFHKLYLGLVGGLSKLLENPRRDEVATQVDISGPLQNPKLSTGQAILNLIRNAFIKSILPGFEREVTSR